MNKLYRLAAEIHGNIDSRNISMETYILKLKLHILSNVSYFQHTFNHNIHSNITDKWEILQAATIIITPEFTCTFLEKCMQGVSI